MSLTEAPLATTYAIRLTAGDDRAGARYAAAGIGAGAHVRVMARYPDISPRFLELEVEGARYVTVPIDFASAVTIEPLPRANGGSS